MVTITLNITPPGGMTDNEALRLFCKSRGWEAGGGETRNQFAKRVLAEEVRQGIRQQRRTEAEAALVVPDDVAVD
jgi:hypothetical protein